MLGRDELLQVAEVVDRERQPVRLARISVPERRRVVEQADAAPPARLDGQHGAPGGPRRGARWIGRTVAPAPARDGAPLIPRRPAPRPHARQQEGGGGLGGRHGGIMARTVQPQSER
jgi:hypothetical protein